MNAQDQVMELLKDKLLPTGAIADSIHMPLSETRDILVELWNTQRIGRRNRGGSEYWHLPGYVDRKPSR